jgi:hypothetical protein
MKAEESLAIRNTLTPMPEFSAVSLAAPGKNLSGKILKYENPT